MEEDIDEGYQQDVFEVVDYLEEHGFYEEGYSE